MSNKSSMKWEILVEIVANLAIRIHDLQKEMAGFWWYTLFIKGLWVGSCIVFCVRLNTIITFISAISRLKHSCFMGFSSNKDILRLHLVTTTNKQSETAFANGTQRMNLKRKNMHRLFVKSLPRNLLPGNFKDILRSERQQIDNTKAENYFMATSWIHWIELQTSARTSFEQFNKVVIFNLWSVFFLN